MFPRLNCTRVSMQDSVPQHSGALVQSQGLLNSDWFHVINISAGPPLCGVTYTGIIASAQCIHSSVEFALDEPPNLQFAAQVSPNFL
ncbi:hypothetical protein KC19_3G120700 [Ceratodon purpureus]|uniref:Uncharacterized protein n=1 Tax=Ceratodon purpureus TaxID=3225 RepID=A0A8T0IK50_CERPU|nr:hypothetical protein KC19_3G120700 [Ceratodon purpureus]